MKLMGNWVLDFFYYSSLKFAGTCYTPGVKTEFKKLRNDEHYKLGFCIYKHRSDGTISAINICAVVFQTVISKYIFQNALLFF